MNLTIKNIPEEVYATLKTSASENGRSLNAEVVQVLTKAAEEIERRRRMVSSRKELERSVDSMPRLSSSVPIIREDRRRH